MPTLNFVGASGDAFQADFDVKFWIKGVSDLSHLTREVCVRPYKKYKDNFAMNTTLITKPPLLNISTSFKNQNCLNHG